MRKVNIKAKWKKEWKKEKEKLQQKQISKKQHYPVFTSSTKREIRQFHVVVVQRRHRDVQKA